MVASYINDARRPGGMENASRRACTHWTWPCNDILGRQEVQRQGMKRCLGQATKHGPEHDGRSVG